MKKMAAVTMGKLFLLMLNDQQLPRENCSLIEFRTYDTGEYSI